MDVTQEQIFLECDGIILPISAENILPPSTGPIGSKLNNPIPKLSMIKSSYNFSSHKNDAGAQLPTF